MDLISLTYNTEEFGAIESVKAASDLLAPVSGKVLEVNAKVSADVSIVNKAAETDGLKMMSMMMAV